MDEKKLLSLLTVNQIPLVQLLKRIIPLIKSHITKTKKRGAVINISSTGGVFPLASQAVYNGTKAFDDFFSQSVGIEYRKGR